MTDAAFERLVRIGMERAAAGHVMPGPDSLPIPSQHIIWRVNGEFPRGTSSLVVNVTAGAGPYSVEEEAVPDDAPRQQFVSAIESMTARLLTAVEAQAKNLPTQPTAPAAQPGTQPIA